MPCPPTHFWIHTLLHHRDIWIESGFKKRLSWNPGNLFLLHCRRICMESEFWDPTLGWASTSCSILLRILHLLLERGTCIFEMPCPHTHFWIHTLLHRRDIWIESGFRDPLWKPIVLRGLIGSHHLHTNERQTKTNRRMGKISIMTQQWIQVRFVPSVLLSELKGTQPWQKFKELFKKRMQKCSFVRQYSSFLDLYWLSKHQSQ